LYSPLLDTAPTYKKAMAEEKLMTELFGESSGDSDGESGELSVTQTFVGQSSSVDRTESGPVPQSEAQEIGSATDGTTRSSSSEESDDFDSALDAVAAAESASLGRQDTVAQRQSITAESELRLRKMPPLPTGGATELRVPKALGFEQLPWEFDYFISTEMKTNKANDNLDASTVPVGNIVRWRWKCDPCVHHTCDSNARLIKWSDGSTQLLVGGNCAVDFVEARSQEFMNVFAKLGEGVIECLSQSQTRVDLRPSKTTMERYRKRVAAVKAQEEQRKKIRQTTIKPRYDADDTQLVAAQKKVAKRALDAAARHQKLSGLTANFLEETADPKY